MIWIYVTVAVATVYLAMRFRRFRNWVEPTLTLAITAGFIAAFAIWFIEGTPGDGAGGQPETPAAVAAIRPDEIKLEAMEYLQGKPATSYKATGTITNTSTLALQSFKLTLVMQDCPAGTCRTLGEDTALIIARVLPGKSQDFDTFFIFPGSDLAEPTALQWSWRISDPRPYIQR